MQGKYKKLSQTIMYMYLALTEIPNRQDSLTLCILMDSSFWFDTINFG